MVLTDHKSEQKFCTGYQKGTTMLSLIQIHTEEMFDKLLMTTPSDGNSSLGLRPGELKSYFKSYLFMSNAFLKTVLVVYYFLNYAVVFILPLGTKVFIFIWLRQFNITIFTFNKQIMKYHNVLKCLESISRFTV